MRWASIRSLDVSNGENVGVSLFVQGCHFHCSGCFNSETWEFEGGNEWTLYTKEKLLDLISRPYIKRVSILGGEPLADENIPDVYDLVNEICTKYPDKKVWLYSGFTWEQIMGINSELSDIRLTIIALCDILVDGEYLEGQRDPTLKWRGSNNQRVIDVQKSLKNGEIVLWKE